MSSSGNRRLPTVADTEAFGADLAGSLTVGDLVILDGPLGAGKTAVARGIGAGLGVTGRITSPTFIIARRHPAGHDDGFAMVHVDAYRLRGGDPDGGAGFVGSVLDDLDALDLDADLTTAVVVVEWGGGLAERLTEQHVLVRMRREPDSDVRTVEWSRQPG
nr:tRNA (adenosine(37)-N6)-threonylcarbamoyltransferase complex ATPase subunit type 1 TsaE [Williamsia sterculiae]